MARPDRGGVALLKDAVLKAAETAGGWPDGLLNYLVAQAKQDCPA